MSKIYDGYIIERKTRTDTSYIFNQPRIVWDNPEMPQGLIDCWKKNANQPNYIKNKVIKVTVTTEDVK